MREIKLPTLASNTNYNTGAATGTACKVVPPTTYLQNGKVPLDGFGAQWQNYIENAIQAQLEKNAQLPFRNFFEVLLVPTVTSVPRFAFHKYIGTTLIANGVNNSVKYIQELGEGAGAPAGVTLAPVSGTFVPKDVVAMDFAKGENTEWLVVGSNSTATTKTIWQIDRENTHSEITAPVAGSVENVCVDPKTGNAYAFCADANRSVFKRDNLGGTTWSLLGSRGPGAVAPAVGTTFCHANNGTLAFLYQNGADTYVDKINTTSFSVTTTLVRATAAPCDVRWSDALGLWMLLTTKNSYTSSNLTSFTTVNTSSALMPFSIDGGCLHPTGVVAWSNGSTGYGVSGAGNLYVQDWIDEPQHVLQFGTFPSNTGRTGYLAQFDGSAIWFMTDTGGTKRLYRSLRS